MDITQNKTVGTKNPHLNSYSHSKYQHNFIIKNSNGNPHDPQGDWPYDSRRDPDSVKTMGIGAQDP